MRLLVCDDHRSFADLLSRFAEAQQGIVTVSAPAHDAESAIAVCAKHHPDVAVMDISLPGRTSGIHAIARIRDVSPSTQVLILTGTGSPGALAQAVDAGAAGFLEKTETPEAIIDAIRAVARGELVIDRERLARVTARLAEEARARQAARAAVESLTGRQLEILRMLAHGRRAEEIAEQLTVSLPTIRTHISRLLRKLGVHSQLEAVAVAARAGLHEPDEPG